MTALRSIRLRYAWAGVLAGLLVPGLLAAQSADVSVVKTGPSQIQAGGTITYLIVTTNNGPSTATNVVVSDTLPPASDFQFVSASRGASRSARRLTWPAITLTAGQSVVDTVIITERAGLGALLTNIAAVSGTQADPNPANNVSQVQTLVVDATVIGVAVAPDGADTTRRLPSNGTAYAYVFTVSNTGTVGSDFHLLGAVGGGVLVLDSITGPGVTRGALPDSARLSGLAAGASAGVSAWYRVGNVAAGLLDSLVLRARSVPVSAVGDSGWSYVRTVRPALMTVKSVAPAGPQVPGAELTYSMVVANGGSEVATAVVLVDSLPAEVAFKLASVVTIVPAGGTALVEYSTDGSSWGYVPTTAGCGAPAGYDGCVTHIRWTLQQPLGAVAPDNSATFEFVARVR